MATNLFGPRGARRAVGIFVLPFFDGVACLRSSPFLHDCLPSGATRRNTTLLGVPPLLWSTIVLCLHSGSRSLPRPKYGTITTRQRGTTCDWRSRRTPSLGLRRRQSKVGRRQRNGSTVEAYLRRYQTGHRAQVGTDGGPRKISPPTRFAG